MTSLPASIFSGHGPQAETPEERLERLVSKFRDQLTHLSENYAACLRDRDGRGTYNESLAAIRRTLDPKARSKPSKKRLHQELEVMINYGAMALARSREGSGRVTPADVNAVA